MSEWERAKKAAEFGMQTDSVGYDECILIGNLTKAADAEITRLQELHLERTKLTTQVIEERDRLKEAEAHFIRMAVLATKHCPQDHRDFEEIKSIIKAIDNKQG